MIPQPKTYLRNALFFTIDRAFKSDRYIWICKCEPSNKIFIPKANLRSSITILWSIFSFSDVPFCEFNEYFLNFEFHFLNFNAFTFDWNCNWQLFMNSIIQIELWELRCWTFIPGERSSGLNFNIDYAVFCISEIYRSAMWMFNNYIRKKTRINSVIAIIYSWVNSTINFVWTLEILLKLGNNLLLIAPSIEFI